MPSPAVLDLDALLAPIPGDSPVGVDLSQDENSAYHALNTLLQECRSEERLVDTGQAEPVGSARWEELARGCEEVLREKSKDLRVACWLLEAQVRIRREPPASEFAGLRDSFKLANTLCTQYWDTLISFPVEEGGDAADRWQPLVGVLSPGEPLIRSIQKIPLTPNEAPGPFSYWEIKNEQDKELKQKDKEDRKPTKLPEIEALFRKGGRGFYEPLLTDLAETRDALAVLEDMMRERMRVSAAKVREALEQVQTAVEHLSHIKLGAAAETGGAAPGTAGDGKASGGAAGGGRMRLDGGFGSRDEALEALMTIARFFREREPQAPISYTIEDAVRRARLPLADLLLELMDEDSRRKMLLNAGIMPPKTE
jgi:type VI secretion system protein ImpA